MLVYCTCISTTRTRDAIDRCCRAHRRRHLRYIRLTRAQQLEQNRQLRERQPLYIIEMVNQVLPDAEPIAACASVDELMAQAKEEMENNKAQAEAEADTEGEAEARASIGATCSPGGADDNREAGEANANANAGAVVMFARELNTRWSRSNLAGSDAAIAEVEDGDGDDVHDGRSSSRSSKLSDDSASSEEGLESGLSPTTRRCLRRLDSTRSGVSVRTSASVVSAGTFCDSEVRVEHTSFKFNTHALTTYDNWLLLS